MGDIEVAAMRIRSGTQRARPTLCLRTKDALAVSSHQEVIKNPIFPGVVALTDGASVES